MSMRWRPRPCSPGAKAIGSRFFVSSKRSEPTKSNSFQPVPTSNKSSGPGTWSSRCRAGARMAERNVLGGPVHPGGREPLSGFYRDGCCSSGPEDLGLHTICAVVTAEFLEHQRMIGNDLSTPMPQFRFPGLVPGDRWCVTAGNWLLAHRDGFAAPVVLASTHQRTLDIVPLEALQEHAVDVPDDPGGL